MSAGEKIMTGRREALAFLGLNAAAAIAASVIPAGAETTATARSAQEKSPAEQMRRFFPNVALQTHDGRSVRFYDDLVKGKKVLINFTFTSCTGTCPRTQANLRRVQDLLGDRVGKDIFLVSISIDPETDTPARLAEYAKTFDAKPGWTYATGTREDVDNIRRHLGLYDTPDYTQHMGILTFGNEPEGKWAAAAALDKPENILYYVLRRVEFKYQHWSTEPSTVTTSRAEGGL
jgi:protein SCO1